MFSCLVAIENRQIFQIHCELQNLILKSNIFSILSVVAKGIARKLLEI